MRSDKKNDGKKRKFKRKQLVKEIKKTHENILLTFEMDQTKKSLSSRGGNQVENEWNSNLKTTRKIRGQTNVRRQNVMG